MRISDWSPAGCSSNRDARLPGVRPILLPQILEDLHRFRGDLAALEAEAPGDVLQLGETRAVAGTVGLETALPGEIQAMPLSKTRRAANGSARADACLAGRVQGLYQAVQAVAHPSQRSEGRGVGKGVVSKGIYRGARY